MNKTQFDLTGRLALVAGGTGKIGSGICRALADHGAHVIVADIQEKECAALVRELSDHSSGHHHSVAGDLSDEKGVAGVMSACKPLAPIHIVVHCIGLISSVPIPGYAVEFEKQSLEAWELAMRTNLTSAFLLAKGVYPYLEKKGRSSVIFLSSIYGSLGPHWGLYSNLDMGNPVAYGASKGGLQQLMRYLATQWAPAVRVNCVAPGGIQRSQSRVFIRRYEELTPLKRMATAEDVSGPVVFLASDAAQYITGHNLVVDGGWSAW